VSASAQEPTPRPPNVLWLVAEDLSPDLGCYGETAVRTPRLDALAAAGVRFTRAFATAPVCSPSRSALMTGMYQTTIGAHNHRSHRDDDHPLPDGVRLLTDRLREAGLFTANVRDLTGDADETFFVGTGKTDWNFAYEGAPFDTDRWSELAAHQPFFAQVNFAETHRGSEWDTAHERIEQPADPARVTVPPYYPDHPVIRADHAQYLNAVMALDKKVGFVLDLLERDGLADDTIVFFFSDHGAAMLRSKQWCYDSGLRIPLLVRWPKNRAAPDGVRPGTVDERLVEGIDLCATTLALVGVARPDGMQGRVFLGPNPDPRREYAFGARDRCDETVDRIRTVRDARYRYIRNLMPERPFLQRNRYKEWSYPALAVLRELNDEGTLDGPPRALFAFRKPDEELYDLDADPHEIVNLVESEAHAEHLARLRAALDAWIEQSNDQGRFLEHPTVLARIERQMKRLYDGRLEQRRRQQGR
jgi:arylsulfatase A-like enzyme